MRNFNFKEDIFNFNYSYVVESIDTYYYSYCLMKDYQGREFTYYSNGIGYYADVVDQYGDFHQFFDNGLITDTYKNGIYTGNMFIVEVYNNDSDDLVFFDEQIDDIVCMGELSTFDLIVEMG